jgi:hypothetical protein
MNEKITFSRFVDILNEQPKTILLQSGEKLYTELQVKNKIDQIIMLIKDAQIDLIRMSGNAKTQKEAETLIGNEYNAGVHGGNIQAFEYAWQHLNHILEKI